MGVNSLPKTVTRQRRGCDLNPRPPVVRLIVISIPSLRHSLIPRLKLWPNCGHVDGRDHVIAAGPPTAVLRLYIRTHTYTQQLRVTCDCPAVGGAGLGAKHGSYVVTTTVARNVAATARSLQSHRSAVMIPTHIIS